MSGRGQLPLVVRDRRSRRRAASPSCGWGLAPPRSRRPRRSPAGQEALSHPDSCRWVGRMVVELRGAGPVQTRRAPGEPAAGAGRRQVVIEIRHYPMQSRWPHLAVLLGLSLASSVLLRGAQPSSASHPRPWARPRGSRRPRPRASPPRRAASSTVELADGVELSLWAPQQLVVDPVAIDLEPGRHAVRDEHDAQQHAARHPSAPGLDGDGAHAAVDGGPARLLPHGDGAGQQREERAGSPT